MLVDQQTNQLNEKYSIKNGIAATMVLNMSTNYFPLFAIGVLSASNYQVSLISSLPQFVGMFAVILGSIFLNQQNNKKKFTAYSIFYTRLFLVFMLFSLFVPKDYRSWVFVILVGLMNFPGSFANLSWQAFIGDLIPEQRRSLFFSERNKVLTIVGVVTTFLIGLILQQFHKDNPLPYEFLFAFSFAAGIMEVFYLMKHVEPEKKKELKQKKLFSRANWQIFRDKPFRYFLFCGLFFNFAWQMSWPLFSIYQIRDAHANGLWISLFSVANQIAQIISFKWWGKMADKHGNAKMMILVSIGMATTPVLTVLSSNLIYLTIVNASSGLFVSGTVLLLFNQLLEVTNEKTRSTYISSYNIFLAIVGFVSPQFGVYLLDQTNMNLSMSISTLLRFVSGLMFFFLYRYLKRSKIEQPAALKKDIKNSLMQL
ncbi:MFS transporter [Neobacillus sp. SM06]|uniref:MFS transporter n=1 Tax=Neobacillus sp. SM06 TaxID=3422492 RepID=UPI003D2A3567